MIDSVLQLGSGGTLAEDWEDDTDADCEVCRDESWVDDLDGLVSGEVLEIGGGDEVESVTRLDRVREVCIRNAHGGVDGVAGTSNWDKEWLVGDERRRWGRDVAGV